jgi:hypothetical protein
MTTNPPPGETGIPSPWLDALDTSSKRLSHLVEDLDPSQLQEPSFNAEWSIAQVLSHLGR